MKIAFVFIWISVAMVTPGVAESAESKQLTVMPSKVTLDNARSRQQLIVTVHGTGGYSRDVTRKVAFKSSDPQIADVDKHGVVRPRRMGKTVIQVAVKNETISVEITVGDLTKATPVSFTNEVMAVVGKAGCNSGTCHGHNSGKGGFKLSLRGNNLRTDHNTITHEDFGRVDLQDPAESLILQMPTAQIEHGGGKRFEVDSDFSRTLHQWLVEGAKSDLGKSVKLNKIEVLPKQNVLSFNSESTSDLQQQLVVLAHFDNGSVRDVTHLAIYELSNEGVVEADSSGLITCKREGEAAVFVRFLGEMGISRFLIIRDRPDFVWTDQPSNNFIDNHIGAKLKRIQVHPSKLSEDAEFLRRVSFDLTGLPPNPDEVRAFLANKQSDKRERKIDELLDREEYGDQWASYWVELSGTSESGDSARFKGMWTLSFWLRDAINRNLPYDQFVRKIVAGKGSSLFNPAMTYSTNQLPRVEVVPQLFLGIRIRCAQCHDHPYDVWKQSDYNELARFFQDVGYKEGPNDPYGREIRRFVSPEKFLPWERDKKISLRFLDGTKAEIPITQDRRDALVDWMFGPAKQLTAQAIVNRVWGRLFGRGIVDPVDEMRFSNPPVNEPLLKALADDFINHKYDFKNLMRTIMRSRTYQLSSKTNPTNQNDNANFSHAYLRRIGAEQLLDSAAMVTGVDDKFRISTPGYRAINLPYTNIRSRFLEIFGRPNERTTACECIRSSETTLPQVMHFISGDTFLDKISNKDGKLAKLLKQNLSDDQLVKELYLRVLSRFPNERERGVGRDHLTKAANRVHAAEDLMWSLLTSTEFAFNH